MSNLHITQSTVRYLKAHWHQERTSEYAPCGMNVALTCSALREAVDTPGAGLYTTLHIYVHGNPDAPGIAVDQALFEWLGGHSEGESNYSSYDRPAYHDEAIGTITLSLSKFSMYCMLCCYKQAHQY